VCASDRLGPHDESGTLTLFSCLDRAAAGVKRTWTAVLLPMCASMLFQSRTYLPAAAQKSARRIVKHMMHPAARWHTGPLWASICERCAGCLRGFHRQPFSNISCAGDLVAGTKPAVAPTGITCSANIVASDQTGCRPGQRCLGRGAGRTGGGPPRSAHAPLVSTARAGG
jgi:hypothetical protein